MRFRTLVALFAALTIVVAGCGGGGGGSAPVPLARLSLLLDATRKSAGRPDGPSLRTTLLAPSGEIVESRVDDLPGGTRPVTIENLSPGLYTLRVDLNSAPNAAGDLVGTFTTRIRIADTTSATVVIGGAPTTVAVRPAPVTLPAGTSIELTAAPVLADGSFTFARPAETPVWTSDSPAVLITEEGVLSGVSRGNANANAVLSGASGSSPVTVTDGVPPARNPFTLLVYMNAANDRYPAALNAINQLERVANGNLRVVVQWKQSRVLFPAASFDGTRRYLVRNDGSETLASELVADLGPEVDMGAPGTLREFVAWARNRYPAGDYGLVIWGTGNGWSDGDVTRDVGFDDEFGTGLSSQELGEALAGFAFRFLAFDASFGANLESISTVLPSAPTIVGVSGPMPLNGFDYTALRALAQNAGTTGASVANSLLDSLITGNPGVPIDGSGVDSGRVNGAISALDALAASVIADIGGPAGEAFQRALSATATEDGRTERDVLTLVGRIRDDASAPASLRTAATAAANALAAAVPIRRQSPALGRPGTGLSIETDLAYTEEYAATPLAQRTRWDDLFRAFREL